MGGTWLVAVAGFGVDSVWMNMGVASGMPTDPELLPLLLVAIGGAFFVDTDNLRIVAMPAAADFARTSLLLSASSNAPGAIRSSKRPAMIAPCPNTAAVPRMPVAFPASSAVIATNWTLPRRFSIGAMVLVSTGGRYAHSASPKPRSRPGSAMPS